MAVQKIKRKIERKVADLQSTLEVTGTLIPGQFALAADTLNILARTLDEGSYTLGVLLSSLTLSNSASPSTSGASYIGVSAISGIGSAANLQTTLENFKTYIDTAAFITTLPANKGGTGFSSYSVGDLLYASSSSVLSKLPVSSDGKVLTLSGGVPTWQTGGGGSGFTGGGATNKITKWDSPTDLTSSSITDDGTSVIIGTVFPSEPTSFSTFKLNVISGNSFGILSTSIDAIPNFMGLAILNPIAAEIGNTSHTAYLTMGFTSVLDPESGVPDGLTITVNKADDFHNPAAAKTNSTISNAGGGSFTLMHDGRIVLNNVLTSVPSDPSTGTVQYYLFDDGTYRQINFRYNDGSVERSGSIPLFENNAATLDNSGTFTINLTDDASNPMGSGTARWERMRNIIFLHIPPIVANLALSTSFLYLNTLPPEIRPSSSTGAFSQLIRGVDNGIAVVLSVEWQTLLGEIDKFRIYKIDQSAFSPATSPDEFHYTGYGSVMSSIGIPQGGITLSYLIDV